MPIKLKITRELPNWLPIIVEQKLIQHYRSSTLKTMKGSIISLSKRVFGKMYFDIDDYLNDPQKVINDLKGISSGKTLANYILQILHRYDLNAEGQQRVMIYDNYLRSFANYQYAPVSHKEQAMINSGLNYDFILRKKVELWERLEKEYNAVNLQRFVLLSLYTDLPPLRQSELINCRVLSCGDLSQEQLITKTQENPNFLCLDSGKLVISDYKTNKHYGVRIIDVPEFLLELIRLWVSETKSSWLLPQISNPESSMSSSGVTNLFNDIFGIPVSTSLIRKLFVSTKVFDGKMSTEDKERIARLMGHNPATQALRYGRFSQLLHPEQNGGQLPKFKYPVKLKKKN